MMDINHRVMELEIAKAERDQARGELMAKDQELMWVVQSKLQLELELTALEAERKALSTERGHIRKERGALQKCKEESFRKDLTVTKLQYSLEARGRSLAAEAAEVAERGMLVAKSELCLKTEMKSLFEELILK